MIAMRADGEISKGEYQAMRSPVDEEVKKLQKALDEIDADIEKIFGGGNHE